MEQQISISILGEAGSDCDDEELAEMGQALLRELRDLEGSGAVEQIDAKARRLVAPPGTKAVGGIDWTTILVTLVGAGGALHALFGFLRDFAQRHEGRTMWVKLPDGTEIDLRGISPDEQRVLLAGLAARTSRPE